MRKILEIILLAGFALVLFKNEGWSSQSLTLETEDQKQISATYYAPPAPNASAVILIPDTRCDGSVFRGFASKLNKAGFAVLAIDLRYKGLIAQGRSNSKWGRWFKYNLTLQAEGSSLKAHAQTSETRCSGDIASCDGPRDRRNQHIQDG